MTLNNAILAEEKHLPLYGELEKDYSVEYIAGGATQNTVRVAQWMSHTEGFTSYLGCVGKDAYGEQLRKAAEGDGVRVLYMEDATEQTGTCAVLVHEHERSLVANVAAANCFKKEHIDSEGVAAHVAAAQITYSAGFFLTVSPDTMVELGTRSAARGAVFSMNLSAPFLPHAFKEPMARVMPFVDILFGNESEAKAYSEANGYPDATIQEVARKIAMEPKASGMRARMVVLTQGAGNVIICHDGKLSEYPVEAIPESEMVDVNGAGDAFVGGFLCKFAQGKAVAECVRAGEWAARYIIKRSGCKMEGKCAYESLE